MEKPFPRNGLLSGMVVVALSLGAALIVGIFIPRWQDPFDVVPSRDLLNAFLITIGVLVLHKVESYVFREYDACPVYLTIAHDAAKVPVGQTHFKLMIAPLMCGLVLIALAMRGPPWPMLLLGAWLGQALHETHHLAKSIASRAIYPGLWTSIAFVVSMDVLVARPWFQDVGWASGLWVYVAAQAVMLAAYVVEHVGWRQRYAAWRGDPT